MTRRDQMIRKANEKQIGTNAGIAATKFQLLIRAEAGAKPDGYAPAIIRDGVLQVCRKRGQCVCVTCGKVAWWKGQGMHSGHFLSSRCNSILFEEDGVHPQCNYCNTFQGGMPKQYRIWMEVMYGPETIERLEKLKLTTRHFDREELVDMRLEFKRRMKIAELALLG